MSDFKAAQNNQTFCPITGDIYDKSEEHKAKLSPSEIDKIVCDWSMEFNVPMTENEQIVLVDRLSLALGA